MNNTLEPCPKVYVAINRVTAAFAKQGIARNHVNRDDGYDYRSIDNLLARLAPLLARHRLLVLPRVLRRQEHDRTIEGSSLVSVNLHVAYDLVSTRDGSTHVIEAFGEAWDRADKATSKASVAAFKSAMFQAFCIPVGEEDADRTTIRAPVHTAEPEGGWVQWCTVLAATASRCENRDALEALRKQEALMLNALRLARPGLYADIGSTFCRALNETSDTKRSTVDA